MIRPATHPIYSDGCRRAVHERLGRNDDPIPTRAWDVELERLIVWKSRSEGRHRAAARENTSWRAPKFDFHAMCRAAVGLRISEVREKSDVRAPVDHESWSGKLGNRIPATQTRGALATTMVTVQTNRGQERKFLWTLQQQRRPPDQGCWLVHECLYVENAIEQTL